MSKNKSNDYTHLAPSGQFRRKFLATTSGQGQNCQHEYLRKVIRKLFLAWKRIVLVSFMFPGFDVWNKAAGHPSCFSVVKIVSRKFSFFSVQTDGLHSFVFLKEAFSEKVVSRWLKLLPFQVQPFICLERHCELCLVRNMPISCSNQAYTQTQLRLTVF